MSGRARFHGAVALVSGGGRGIGRAIAEGLAAEGAVVGVASRSTDECRAVADAITRAGGRAEPLRLDVTDPADCARAVADLSAAHGRITHLVAAAGVSPVRQRAEHHDLEALRVLADVNLIGAFQLVQAAAPDLLEGGGSVLLVASTTAAKGSPRVAGYAATKAGLVSLGRTLAREWGDRGVRVNVIGPGYVMTAMTREMLSRDHLRDEVLGDTPLGRLGELREVAGPALFLLSDEASYVTGAHLLVDGGMAA